MLRESGNEEVQNCFWFFLVTPVQTSFPYKDLPKMAENINNGWKFDSLNSTEYV